MATFLDFPPEILEQVLFELDPTEVAALSQTCVTFAQLVYGSKNEVLWRTLYLNLGLDDPRECIDPLGYPVKGTNWRNALQRVVRTRTIAKKPDICKPEERTTVWQTLLDLVCHSAPVFSIVSDELSCNLVWVGSLLRTGHFLEPSLWEAFPEVHQLRAHFHTLYGLTIADFDPQRRVETRCAVYALRRYTEFNFFGPFLSDGSGHVDWEQMLAIQHVMSMHVVPRRLTHDTTNTFYIGSPMSLPFCNSILTPEMVLDETLDWAGVEGAWQCSFCFCDHRDLLIFNNYRSPDGPLRQEIFEDPEFTEAFTVLEMRLKIKSTEPDDAHPTRPVLYFEGTSGDSHAEMEGWVKATPDGHIRWHFVSNQVWASEGIQVGNVRSTFGVLGVWSTVHHELSDPVGPFWLRKNLDK